MMEVLGSNPGGSHQIFVVKEITLQRFWRAVMAEKSNTQVVWGWVKKYPFLSAIAAYIGGNFLSLVLFGGFNPLALVTNLFPAVGAFFLSLAYNKERYDREDKPKTFGKLF